MKKNTADGNVVSVCVFELAFFAYNSPQSEQTTLIRMWKITGEKITGRGFGGNQLHGVYSVTACRDLICHASAG